METVNTWLRAGFTVLILIAAAWWLYVVGAHLGSAPSKSADGTVVDEYQRAKDVLLVVLPLVTTVIGYWFGAQGKERAEGQAERAQKESRAVLAASNDPDIISKARQIYPDAFTS